jgi:ABC-type nitrate/sulfonate/bicarbonate transport system permease component
MSKKLTNISVSIIGILLLPIIWFVLHYWVGVGERYLPDPVRVYQAIFDIDPNIWIQTLYTLGRFVIGSFLGIVAGIAIGLLIYRSKTIYRLLSPSIQALRATPAVAVIPFFLLWFGFSEIGKYLLVIFGIGINLAIATYQILRTTPERYTVLFHSFALEPRKQIMNFALPLVMEEILPTIRFSLGTAIGLVIVAEYLGAQIGLGHLIEVARQTFSLHVVLLSDILLGIIIVVVDLLLVRLWKKIVFWNKETK